MINISGGIDAPHRVKILRIWRLLKIGMIPGTFGTFTPIFLTGAGSGRKAG
jgi:hypothetical protein